MTPSIRWVANLSLLFTEHALLDRPAAARKAGFQEVEFWWPFGTTGRPDRCDVEAFVGSIESAGVSLTAMNLFAGDMPAGERGVLSYPERTEEFHHSVGVAMEVGSRLGTRLFNAPYGHRRAGLEHEAQDEVADQSLSIAARAAAEIGGVVMLEPVSGMPAYPIKTCTDAIRIMDRVHAATGVNNLGLLVDQFHVSMNGGDAVADSNAYAHRIAHVQLADTPGRGEPGTGDADFQEVIHALRNHGYAGAFALEYIPTTDTERSLETWRRSMESWTELGTGELPGEPK
jgi:hydroxypyruvate isomerase